MADFRVGLEKIWVTVEALFPVVNGIFGNRGPAYFSLPGNQSALVVVAGSRNAILSNRHFTNGRHECYGWQQMKRTRR
jgi:hypothetical protein